MKKPVDAHVHAFAPEQISDRSELAERDPLFSEMYGSPQAGMATPEETIRALDDADFAGALVAGFAFAARCDRDRQNDCLLAAAGGPSARLAVLATLDLSDPGWETAAERALERGAAGFGELRPHNQGWDPLGAQAARLYGLCGDAGAVLLWHVSEPVGHLYAGKQGGIAPSELWEVAALNPDIRQIAAHLGGGLPFFLQMPEVQETLGNVWFDTAATSLLYDDRAVARVLDLAGSRRVLFGSDYPLLSPRRHLKRVLGAIAAEYVEDVCGGNLREMLGRPWK